jgi:hypothetical protein
METPTVVLNSTAFDFQRDLSRYWRHVRKQEGVALTAQGWVYKSNFKTFLTAMNMPTGVLSNDEQSNGKLWFIRRLLVFMRELQGDNFAEQLFVTPNSKLLSLPMAQRVRWTFESWRDGGAWNELLRLHGQSVSYDHRRDAPPGLTKSRNSVLKALAKLHGVSGQETSAATSSDDTGQPAGTPWTPMTVLLAHIKRTDYGFLFERRRGTGVTGMYSSPYYASNNPYGMSFSVARDEASGWDVVERAFIVELLTGPLFWLGLVELGYNAGGPVGENNMPVAYRLTETGAWLTGIAEQPSFVESGGRVVVQPNFNVLAMEPISDALLVDLDFFADSLGGDRAITYELTRESLYRGQRSGWSAERVIAYLEKHQGAPVPANVSRTMLEWEQAHRRITFHRRKLVVQFADEDAEAQASLSLAPFKPHALSAQFVLLGNGDSERVNTALREAGWIPTVQPAGQAGYENSLRVDDDGSITFLQPAPSVYALGRLKQFAEDGAGGAIRVTPGSVRAAMNRDLDIEQLLAMLAEMHNGPVSAQLEKSIRRWAGFFGTGAIRGVTLLELSNADVLANLLGDPVVGIWLTPIEGSSKPMALVAPEHIDDLRAALEERGVTL